MNPSQCKTLEGITFGLMGRNFAGMTRQEFANVLQNFGASFSSSYHASKKLTHIVATPDANAASPYLALNKDKVISVVEFVNKYLPKEVREQMSEGIRQMLANAPKAGSEATVNDIGSDEKDSSKKSRKRKRDEVEQKVEHEKKEKKKHKHKHKHKGSKGTAETEMQENSGSDDGSGAVSRQNQPPAQSNPALSEEQSLATYRKRKNSMYLENLKSFGEGKLEIFTGDDVPDEFHMEFPPGVTSKRLSTAFDYPAGQFIHELHQKQI